MDVLQVFLFGPPRLERGGQVLAVHRRKMLALLAYLFITQQPHSRDALAAQFWPDYDASSALGNLRRDLSRLKEILGEHFLIIERDRVQVDPAAAFCVDAAAFEDNIRQAVDHGHFHPGGEIPAPCEHCLHLLEEAARLYTDDFMAGFSLPDSPAFDDWQFFQAERLRGLLAGVLTHLAHWRIAHGAYEEALDPARRWLALDPLHEPAQRMVIQLYAWAGQPSAALRQYAAMVDLLDKELGVEPEEESRLLYETIRSRRITPPALRLEEQPEKRTPMPVTGPEVSERYQFDTLLSSGGFGEIYHGRDLVTGGEVAIKRLQAQLVERQPAIVDRFLREGELLSKLSHPNIVPMLDFYERDGQYNLVMAYLPGGTLRELLDQANPLPMDRVLEIALELADALSRAHHLHILHRDLKPENILLDGAGHPRLIDFGLALLESPNARLTQAGMLLGSPAYMSPEALRGQELDARSDIWSFGVLLFELLSGQLPFKGEQFYTLMDQITNQPAPPLHQFCPDIPPALERLVARMLEKDLDQRLSSMRQAAAELEAIRLGKSPDQERRVSTGQDRRVSTGESALKDESPIQTPLRLLDLPAQSTPLIGREADLAHLNDLLNNPECRLITLVGTGGIGKTRLAIETAARAAKDLSSGAVFVPLAPVSEMQFLLPALANALRIRNSPGADMKEQLLQRVRNLNMLLVLDNFEHLLGASELLTEILAAAPQVRLIVTSRERVNLLEEWVYEVNGLPYPPPGEPVPGGAESWLKNFSAVQLFVERARRVDPNLSVDEETLGQIIRICQLVEGMPLALELAAPWVRAMTCKEIAKELEHGLDLLTTSMRNLPERHQSIRVIFDQSWQALVPADQAVLARLSVFHNGCTREAAEQVAKARPSSLMTLVDKALLRHRGNRYEMHELVRQYAAERLAVEPGQTEAVLDQHHRYYLGLAGQMTPWLKGGRQLEAGQLIAADIDNVRAAWYRAVQRGDSTAVAQAAEACWLYGEFSGYLAPAEAAFRKAADAFQHSQDDRALAGFLRAAQGSMLARQWYFEPGRALMEQGLKLMHEASPPDPEKIGFTLVFYTFQKIINGQFEEAARFAKEGLDYFPQTGDRWSQAGALWLLGGSRLYQGQLQRAEQYLNQCVDVCRAIGELRIRTYATSNLGMVFLWYGRMDEARAYFNESLRISKSCNDRLARADALCEHSRLFLTTGEYDRAIETARSCIDLYHELGREKVSLPSIVLGKALRAKRANGAYEALNEGLEAARSVNHQPDIAYGLEGLGSLALDQQNYDLAEDYFRQALEIWTKIGSEPEIAKILCRCAHASMTSGSNDSQHIREQFGQALRLAHRHQSGMVAISALVGLEALNIRDGDPGSAGPLLLFARQHPATPHEVKVWVDALIQQIGAGPDTGVLTLSWQQLADDYERSL